MTYSEPARRAHRRAKYRVHRERRRRALLGTVALLLLGYLALSGAGQLANDNGRALDTRRAPNDKGRLLNRARTASPAIGWPQSGQAAFVLGGGRAAASPGQRPAPIASLAKVMTAYLTLRRHPLNGEDEGFTITASAADAQTAAGDAARNQSIVAIQAGEQLTERELLEALLIPSGNNVAQMLATLLAGSEARFVDEMNAEARTLGMARTTYGDPSGFDPGTVSTAADQLRIFRRAMRFPVFREIVSLPSVTLPVAGTLTNFNPLIAEGFAGKTGSDSAAGGCLAFFTHVSVGGRRLTAAGVVMGQGEGSNTSAILDAAGKAAEQMVDSVGPATRVGTAREPDAVGVPYLP